MLQQPDPHPELQRLDIVGVPGDVTALPVREEIAGFVVGGGPGEPAGVGGVSIAGASGAYVVAAVLAVVLDDVATLSSRPRPGQ